MKKSIVLLAAAICLTIPLLSIIRTQPSSGIANVGETMRFQTDCNSELRCNWYWGDGSSTLGIRDLTSIWVDHYYKNPGSYTVHVHRLSASTYPSCGFDEYRTVTIIENRLIAFSPAPPTTALRITFTAVNFKTPTNITWEMGDGKVYAHQGAVISYTYARAGAYSIRAFDWNGDMKTIPVTLLLTVAEPVRAITYYPELPRVDQSVNIQAVNFKSASIEWNFGDGSPEQTYSAMVSHRYQNPGIFIITAEENGMDAAAVNRTITILPENRSLVLSAPELRPDEPLTVTAVNFRDRLVLWDFGDGTALLSGPPMITHIYKRAGDFIITARDENGASGKKIQAQVRILGISDQVNLEIAEISLDNGKYYKVIPKNSKDIKAELKMKMRGTGIVSGYWIVDNQPYQFFNETVYQGQIKNIYTQEIPGLPVFDPGMHTITVQLTRPATETVVFPTLRYFVLPYENIIPVLAPQDGAIIKEDEIAEFSWKKPLGGSYYQIAFANSLFPLLQNDPTVKWLDCPDHLNFVPDSEVWNSLKRNQWTFWKVRAMDSAKSILAESSIQEIKIIIPGAKVGIEKITDLDGNGIVFSNSFAATRTDPVMIRGYLTYPGDAEFLVLRIYTNDTLVDQLLFRDVKKDEKRSFETSVPNKEKENQVVFQVLKSSSPSVIIGYLELKLKKE